MNEERRRKKQKGKQSKYSKERRNIKTCKKQAKLWKELYRRDKLIGNRVRYLEVSHWKEPECPQASISLRLSLDIPTLMTEPQWTQSQFA